MREDDLLDFDSKLYDVENPRQSFGREARTARERGSRSCSCPSKESIRLLDDAEVQHGTAVPDGAGTMPRRVANHA